MSDPQQLEGTVTKIEASSSWVDAGAAGRFRCDLRAKITRHSNQRLAVGDRVVFTPTPTPGAETDAPPTTDATAEPRGGVIEKILPRKSALMRPRSYKRDQILCANMDQVLVVISVYEPPYKRNFVDRLLVGVEREGLSPVLVFNKLDLADAEYRSVCADDAKVYRGLGYGVVGTSVPTGEGIEDLRAIMKDRISAVAGPSGVGKSTLLNAVVPGLRLRTAEVSESSGRGKHTTTSAELVPLPHGGFVADTPGIRGFGLGDLAPRDLPGLFRDFAPHASLCKFRDCSHREEPGCAILALVEAGVIDEERYDSYVKLRDELEAEDADQKTAKKR